MIGVCLQEREYLLRLAKKMTRLLGYMVEQNVEILPMPDVAEKFEQYSSATSSGSNRRNGPR